ncbi:vomeronasal type-2 receptor 26-like [Aquarana catesbeiana]|uniref:vomeronasal type-2 receptor 26-like n=1 Tax=Aquarana catesbeiana TaxID=8400 RepID=UPI003CC99FAF
MAHPITATLASKQGLCSFLGGTRFEKTLKDAIHRVIEGKSSFFPKIGMVIVSSFVWAGLDAGLSYNTQCFDFISPNGNSLVEKAAGNLLSEGGHQDSSSNLSVFSKWDLLLVPQSQCNEKCPPGYRKAPKEVIHSCCYNCVPCDVGKISNITDSEICHKCPIEEWSDKKKVKCIPKTQDFLSYENDKLVLVLSSVSVLLCVVTLVVFQSLICYWDTPIVKANNRTVSFILLTSILLSFLCVFFFLGRPVDITCILRQNLYGIFFTIAVSSVLAKTIMVYVAFKATKPGSVWRKWVGVKAVNFVLICSSVQVVICVIWLSVSPPYQEYDMHSYPGKIIIQCNEGSVIGFYFMLGYLGFLAAVSFVLAFMVRKLPDSFNEAKYITFSMLVFCSVWIAMIPAYLSTSGKYVVGVEIFAILTSSAGLLGFIFFPKVYVLMVKPYLNFRHILQTKH